jgi:rhamnogalacturonyl hydrolase YesR
MRTLFDGVEKRLYDRATGLWWSEGRYAHTVFYGAQANGWVLAGLAKVLQALPADDPGRAEYTRIMVRMAATLRRLQGRDGFWSPDLLLPWPSGPESTGTALLAYGIAWGVDNGVLDAATYTPVVTRAWQGLTTKALRPDGFIGYVQDRDAAPWERPAADVTGAQGVGAFLIAGHEVAQMTPGCP